MKRTEQKIVNQALLHSLIDYGYMQMSVDPTFQGLIKKMTTAWKDFCIQTIEHKRQFVFLEHLHGGYTCKQGNASCFKEKFQYTIAYHEWCVEKSAIIMLSAETRLFDVSKEFMSALEPVIMDIGQIVSQQSGHDIRTLIRKALDTWTLCYVRYAPRFFQKGEILEPSCIDNAMTIQLYEDTPGIEVLWNHTWHKTPLEQGRFLVYGGLLSQYYSDGAIKALMYRITSTEEIHAQGRVSLFFSADFGDVAYNKDIYGAIQNIFPQGENYVMSVKDYSHFFVST